MPSRFQSARVPSVSAVGKRLGGAVAICATCVGLIAPALASADFGAIALNIGTGATGISYNYGTVGAAKKRARHECGKGCRTVVWVRDGYAALVRAPAPNVYYAAGAGLTKAAAFRQARAHAHNSHAKRYTWVFSGY